MLLRFITMTNAKQSTSAFYDLEVALFREEMCQAFVRTLYNGKWLIKVRVEKLGWTETIIKFPMLMRRTKMWSLRWNWKLVRYEGIWGRVVAIDPTLFSEWSGRGYRKTKKKKEKKKTDLRWWWIWWYIFDESSRNSVPHDFQQFLSGKILPKSRKMFFFLRFFVVISLQFMFASTTKNARGAKSWSRDNLTTARETA